MRVVSLDSPSEDIRNGGEFEILESGKIVVPNTPYLAGSGVFTDSCVNYLVTHMGYELAQILPMVTVNPYRLFGLAPPEITQGYVGPLLLITPSENQLNIQLIQ